MNNDITEDYCSEEVGKLLGEKGFPQNNDAGWIECPTHSLVIKWLKENHNCFIEPCTSIVNEFGKTKTVWRVLIIDSFKDRVGFSTREGTEPSADQAIKIALNLLITKKHKKR